jgi:hypothetical protein
MFRAFRKQAHVNKVARYLDRTEPGWADKINLGTLDLADGDECVVAQVFRGRGGYWENIHQFYADGMPVYVFTSEAFHNQWVKVIKPRQTKKPDRPLYVPKEWDTEREKELV